MPANRLITCWIIAAVATMMTLSSYGEAVAGPSDSEARFYQCVLDDARTTGAGNPMVAAYNSADNCSSEGLTEAEREQVIGAVVRQIMNDVGMGCIGTGCD